MRGGPQDAAPGSAFRSLTNSDSGSVTARISVANLRLGPDPPLASNSGCEAADFRDFERGSIALVRRGTCTWAPPAPTRLSTMKLCLNASASFWLTMRAMMSVLPPAANGTMTVTVLAGQSVCAYATPDTNTAARASPASRLRGFPMHRWIMATGKFCTSRPPDIAAPTLPNLMESPALGVNVPSFRRI
jgi:hypothetical protein